MLKTAPTFSGPHRPAGVRLVNAVGAALSRVGLRLPRLDLPSLLRASKVDGARLDADDDAAFVERVVALLDDANGAAQLNAVGRWIMHARLANRLANRLRVRQWLLDHPRTQDVPVEQPLFVVGQPRTGTTLLYLLLAQDPQARAPRLWEVNTPVPPPLPDAGRDDPRYVRCERELARLHKYLPELAVAHDFAANVPDECYPMLETAGFSPTFFLYLDVPAYWTRLKAASAAEAEAAYALFRRQIQILLVRAEGRRWVSKSPAHLWFLDALARTFPDTGIIATQREPVEAIPSLCSLTAITRSASSDYVDPAYIGRVVLDWFAESQRRTRAARAGIDPSRIADVPYRRLIDAPIGVVGELYERFRLPFTHLFERRMRDWLGANPQHRKGVHRYTLEQFGLTAAAIEEAAAGYGAA
ncbi:MAG TPA: sulfotransferase [Casimicrobiaceae bacterium]|nr:sulfotransferase [Casimicrobiaceae bacterium]